MKLAGVRGECFSQTYENSESGGDIHFLSVCGVSELSKVVIADVSGHGAATAAASAVIHNALAESIGARDNMQMLSEVNKAFLASDLGDVFHFTTMASLIIESRDRGMVYAYAGHPALLRGDAATGKFVAIEPEDERRGGIPLGILEGTAYQQHFIQLEQGDVIVAYTDAFSEARADDGSFLGEAGLARLLEGASSMAPDVLKTHVLESLDGRLDDDASLLIFEVL